ncbi:MAG: hypothetical protein EXR00_01755 [Alphaproteobacteria bacterium]|nr:hypothetical protein [Alphaproteobacteria bacterium]
MRKTATLAILAFVAGSAAPVLAHHSGAMFDDDKEVVLNGTVKQFQYTNPHSWIQLMVAKPGAAPVEWSIETGAPIVLLRAGIKRTALVPGDKVTIRVHPLRNGGPGGSLVNVTKADGTVLSTRGGAAAP